MSELPILITDLTSILVIAALTTVICKRVNLPSVLGYILAGFLVGPVVNSVFTVSDLSQIETWSELGVIFLMFGLGLEFPVKKMGEVGITGFLSAGMQAVGMGAVGFFVGELLGWSSMDSVFLGVMLAMSSTMIAMKNIEDLGLKNEKFSSLAMGTLVIEDIIAIFAMVVLSTIAVSQSISGLALAEHLGLLLLYLALWLLLGIFLIPSLMKKLVGLMNDEVLLVFSLGLCFLMAVLAERIGLSTELGAFLAGSLLAGTVHAERIEHLVTPVKNLFGAVFFVSVGFMVQPAMIATYWLPILILSLLAVVGKLLFLTLGSLAAGQELGISLQAAASQTQVGEFSFIIAGLGRSLGVTGDFLYPTIVAVSVLTTFTTPFVMRFSVPLIGWLQRVLPDKWLSAIESYSRGRQEEKADSSGDWPQFLRRYFRTFALYGISAVGVILLGVKVLYPFLTTLPGRSDSLMRLISCGCIYLLLAVLLPALLRTPKRYFTALWLGSIYNRLMLCFLLIVRMAAAVLLAVIPAFLLFNVHPLWLALLAGPLVFAVSRSDRLAGRYLEVEARFLANFNERKLADRLEAEQSGSSDHHWLTEQLLVRELVADASFAGENRALKELNWGKLHHIKVIKIIRGREHINIPEGYVRLKSGDRLLILGDAKALDNFCRQVTSLGLSRAGEEQSLKLFIESQSDVAQSRQLLCCGVTLDKDTRQTGKSIRDSGIKEEWNAFLIGLERSGLPIPEPDASLNLKAGDLLWVMGSQDMASKLMRMGLLD